MTKVVVTTECSRPLFTLLSGGTIVHTKEAKGQQNQIGTPVKRSAALKEILRKKKKSVPCVYSVPNPSTVIRAASQ